MIRRQPRSTLFPTRRSSDLIEFVGGDLASRGGINVAIGTVVDNATANPNDGGATVISDPTGPRLQTSTFPYFTSVYRDRKSTRLNSSHTVISYAVFCLKKKK